MKIVTVEAHFPELKGGACYQNGRGQAGVWTLATKRAMQQIKKNLGRKKFTYFTATITVAEVKPPKETPDEGTQNR